MSVLSKVAGRSPGASFKARLGLAAIRATRTLIQGIAGAFGASGVGTAVLTASYWQLVGYSCIAAVITAFVSFLNNVAGGLPPDPTQKQQGA
jgi:hypothetical protein